MASLISEATTQIQHGQVAEIRKQLKGLEKYDAIDIICNSFDFGNSLTK